MAAVASRCVGREWHVSSRITDVIGQKGELRKLGALGTKAVPVSWTTRTTRHRHAQRRLVAARNSEEEVKAAAEAEAQRRLAEDTSMTSSAQIWEADAYSTPRVGFLESIEIYKRSKHGAGWSGVTLMVIYFVLLAVGLNLLVAK